MATFGKRADVFGQTVLLEVEGQVRSAFADHPEFANENLVGCIAKRVAGQIVSRWDRLSRVRSAVAAARACDAEADSSANIPVKLSRGLKRKLGSASAAKRQMRRASPQLAGRGSRSGELTPFGEKLQEALSRKET